MLITLLIPGVEIVGYCSKEKRNRENREIIATQPEDLVMASMTKVYGGNSTPRKTEKLPTSNVVDSDDD